MRLDGMPLLIILYIVPHSYNAEDRLCPVSLVRRCGIGNGRCGRGHITLQRRRAPRTGEASLSAECTLSRHQTACGYGRQSLLAHTMPWWTGNASVSTRAAWCNASVQLHLRASTLASSAADGRRGCGLSANTYLAARDTWLLCRNLRVNSVDSTERVKKVTIKH